jgi:GNAT superfamily N-acetyltransferase
MRGTTSATRSWARATRYPPRGTESSRPSRTEGIDAVVEARVAEDAPVPNVLCALQILIAPEYRGQGLSRRMIERMAEIGRDHGLDTLSYLSWRRQDGTHFDPWLRTHERLGADIDDHLAQRETTDQAQRICVRRLRPIGVGCDVRL